MAQGDRAEPGRYSQDSSGTQRQTGECPHLRLLHRRFKLFKSLGMRGKAVRPYMESPLAHTPCNASEVTGD